MTFECIDIDQTVTLIEQENAVIIDIRDPASFRSGHIEDAIHINNDNVQTFVEGANKSVPLIVCCYHGNMSKGAADFFDRQGFEKSYSLDGGYTEWAKRF
jgi:thiosulfate sulfurtransferase